MYCVAGETKTSASHLKTPLILLVAMLGLAMLMLVPMVIIFAKELL